MSRKSSKNARMPVWTNNMLLAKLKQNNTKKKSIGRMEARTHNLERTQTFSEHSGMKLGKLKSNRIESGTGCPGRLWNIFPWRY